MTRLFRFKLKAVTAYLRMKRGFKRPKAAWGLMLNFILGYVIGSSIDGWMGFGFFLIALSGDFVAAWRHGGKKDLKEVKPA